MAKKTVFKEVENALKAAEAEQMPEYEDRRAVHRTPAVDYVIEPDPILAEGDNRVIVPPAEAEPEIYSGEIDLPPGATEEDVLKAIREHKSAPVTPRIEIARDADPIARLAASMEKLAERQQTQSIDPQLAQLLQGMMATMQVLVQQQIAGNTANADALRKSQDPSNMFAPDFSVFNPRGEKAHPRPKLKCRMFIPWEAEWESLTREEIELLNLLEPGEFFLKRNDESRVIMTVKADINPNSGKYDRLLMNSETALNNDYHWLMPPLRIWLREILKQRPATKAAARKIMTMEHEFLLVKHYGPDFEEKLKMLNKTVQEAIEDNEEVEVG